MCGVYDRRYNVDTINEIVFVKSLRKISFISCLEPVNTLPLSDQIGMYCTSSIITIFQAVSILLPKLGIGERPTGFYSIWTNEYFLFVLLLQCFVMKTTFGESYSNLYLI